VAEQHVPGLPDPGVVVPRFSQYYLYDPPSNSLEEIAGVEAISDRPTYYLRMLLLPNGDVAVSSESTQVSYYTPDEPPLEAWRPVITSPTPLALFRGVTNSVSGRGFNGISQAVSFGDDATMATNYPLVRLRDSAGHVWYFRTHDHSSMGVQVPGDQTTFFDIPWDFPGGTGYCLEVVANGVPSRCVPVTVASPAPHIVRYPVYEKLIGNLADGGLFGVVGNHIIPVPEGPNDPAGLVRRARKALQGVGQNVRALREVGKQTLKARVAQYRSTAKVPLANLRNHRRAS